LKTSPGTPDEAQVPAGDRHHSVRQRALHRALLDHPDPAVPAPERRACGEPDALRPAPLGAPGHDRRALGAAAALLLPHARVSAHGLPAPPAAAAQMSRRKCRSRAELSQSLRKSLLKKTVLGTPYTETFRQWENE